MTPQQKPGRSKQDYQTPDVFIEAVKKRLGIRSFAFDFAADKFNYQAPHWWGIEVNALDMPIEMWADRCSDGWGWLNPPYAHIEPWVICCLQAMCMGGRIALLVPASVGSNWFRYYTHGISGVTTLFLNGRIPFMPDKPTWLYPKDCMLVLFDGQSQQQPYHSDVWTWRWRGILDGQV